MIGDCNLFLLDRETEEEEEREREEGQFFESPPRLFEAEVMIAEKDYRRHGYASEAVRLLMLYAIRVLGATGFVAKILDSNNASMLLFEHQLGFKEVKRVAAFHEVHLRLSVRTKEDEEQWLEQQWGAKGERRRVVVGPYTSARHREVILD